MTPFKNTSRRIKPADRENVQMIPPGPHGQREAFTLIEMLVVIAILALLAALIIPSISRAMDSAQARKCMSNLRNINLAHQMYMTENNGRIVYGRGHGGQQFYDDLEPYLISVTAQGKLPEGIWRCPSTTELPPGNTRSHFGKNGYINETTDPGSDPTTRGWTLLMIPNPAEIFAFGESTFREIRNYGHIATRHRGRANMSYFDGSIRAVDPAELPAFHHRRPPFRPVTQKSGWN
ncbi:MAG: prepilin-type N-terminal cleavage/methylation domain-containing protein [Verrucomicrobia bacterium]|nr:prepilin-type N-terminal cleavage/methylation domain-containing protein [Verrucomicrobiota bacterium]MCH8525539.1 prepilin-type N-terminal cleavage/methylation domain-containing protein [Kiritimatiellia bacterium]